MKEIFHSNYYNFATIHPINLKSVSLVYYSLLYILLYWAKQDNQLEAEKSPSKASVGKYYNNYIAYRLFITS